MKIKTLTLALAGTAIMAVAASKDPAVMTINGKDVKLSEFNYLYQKNKQQQIEQETLDKYVDRFVLYKMKVADAEEAGLDTTKSFIKELDGYKADLLKPYLEDTVLREKLVDEAYNMMQTNVSFHHIMTPLGTDPIDNAGQLAQLDSIRNVIAANDELSEEEWTELIQKYTIDPTFKRNKGHYKNTKLGLGGFPYEFEKVVYETPVGEMCKPFRTDYGNHLVYVTNKTPDKGQVHVQHILKLFPREATDSIKLALKGQIDSLYNCAVAGEDFAALAKKFSDDKGSAAHGGEIRWFYVSEMVPEFEKVAFSLTDGEISEPFETSYGYHIVKKLGHRTPSLQDCRQYIEKVMSRDERA
ncbi:MAG: peptidylprolyl isomerase, partial [Muribaculaceae bacterium]|nr:peptidylprolyl isomerase [Muribaculaceae bacterium]